MFFTPRSASDDLPNDRKRVDFSQVLYFISRDAFSLKTSLKKLSSREMPLFSRYSRNCRFPIITFLPISLHKYLFSNAVFSSNGDYAAFLLMPTKQLRLVSEFIRNRRRSSFFISCDRTVNFIVDAVTRARGQQQQVLLFSISWYSSFGRSSVTFRQRKFSGLRGCSIADVVFGIMNQEHAI